MGRSPFNLILSCRSLHASARRLIASSISTEQYWCESCLARDGERHLHTLTLIIMCYTTTQYHTPCGHYGNKLIYGEPCIRATANHGHKSRGCWDSVDMGIEDVASMCPKCTKRLMPSPSISGISTPLGSPGSSLSLTRAKSSLLSVGRANQSDYFDDVKADGLERVGSSVSLSSVASVDSAASPRSAKQYESGSEDVELLNLHWRTFGGSEASVGFKRGAP